MLRFVQNSWNWWISDDKFAGIANSFYNGQGLEIRKNPFSLTLAKKVTKDSSTVVDSLVNKLLYVSSRAILLAFWGSIFKKDLGGGWSKCSTTWWEQATVFWDYIYWLYSNKLHRILISDIDEADWTTYTDVGTTFPITLTSYYNWTNMITYANKLYFWNWDNLCEWDWTIFTQDKLTIKDEIFQEITITGWAFRLYTRGVGFSWQYFWDGISDGWTQWVKWDGAYIDSVVEKDGRDYVVTWWDLYVTDWYNRQRLMDIRYTKWWLTKIDGLIYFWGNWWVYTFWNLNKNYPEVLNFEYPYSQFSTDEYPTIWAIAKWLWGIYFSRSNWTDYWIDKISWTNTTGFIEGLINTWEMASGEKEIKRLFVSYMPIDSWTDTYVDENADIYVDEEVRVYSDEISEDELIDIEIQTDISGNYNDWLTVLWNEDKLYKESYWPFDNFNYIQYKVTLKSSNGVTPEVKEIWFDYDLIINDQWKKSNDKS